MKEIYASSSPSTQQVDTMQNYYRLHASIYDLTRWSFLFGRKGLIRRTQVLHPEAKRILEVGCGTGIQLVSLTQHFPKAKIWGMDVSENMLQKSEKRIENYKDRVDLIQAPYQLGKSHFQDSLDLILFSYSLSMINPQWEELLEQASRDLKPGGLIAVVDFYDSRFPWFKRHMGNNHVRMDAHMTPVLEKYFAPLLNQTYPAYWGVWQYFMYIGRRRP